PAQGITIGGRMPVLDAGAWLELATGGTGATSSLVRGIDVLADDLLLASRHFSDTRVGLEADADSTRLRLDGDALSGTVSIPAANLVGRGIHAEFARMHWPEPPPDAPDAGTFTQVAPAALPPLHIAIDDFRLGSANFGAAQFDSTPQADGMRIERLATKSPDISMDASGQWTGRAGDSRTRLAIELGAPNLGKMMDALGFPGLIDGGDTRATIDASFAGPPSAFALARLDGTLAIEVGEGRILDVEPGAGRLFGLFSLAEIPRRLSLDFSDFFRSGLSFNSITGRFRLADGNAWTHDLRIESPAADILVTGRTGLRSKDYDQYMDVTPHAGATLPIVGAIAAGPVGAAAGLVMQGILNKPIGKAVERRYHVTGAWANPEIIQMARTRPGLPPPPPDAAPPGPPTETEPTPAGPAPEPAQVPWQVLPEPDALQRGRL
ncbi:MAG TPA: AsmA-like C-terminal region-containing protein, partial [Dokdonella sp.]